MQDITLNQNSTELGTDRIKNNCFKATFAYLNSADRVLKKGTFSAGFRLRVGH